MEKTAAGQSDQLKEYVIGVEVYERGGSYDPRTDAIVRVEAGRLRAKLQRYYETEGREDPVVISIPKGSYAPVIVVRVPPHASSVLGAPRPAVPVRFYALALLAILLIAAFALYWRENRNRRESAARTADQQVPVVWPRR